VSAVHEGLRSINYQDLIVAKALHGNQNFPG